MEKQQEHNKVVSTEEIMKVLPHRFPMLLIDTILEYEAGSYAIAKKVFSYTESYFAGHYPKHPIVPGTILLESLSQTASFAILSGGGRETEGSLLFTGVNKLRFYRAVYPGDCVIFRAEIIKNRHGIWDVSGEGMGLENEICISAEMSFINRNSR